MRSSYESLAKDFISLIILIASIYLALEDRASTATLMAGLFVITYLLADVDRLQSFTAFGIKAELREKIKEAQFTIDQAREVALASANQTFYLYAVQGRPMGGDYRRKNQLIQKLNESMIAIGVDGASLRSAREEMFAFAQFDMISGIQERLDKTLQAHGVSYNDCPDLVTYAGDDITAFDKVQKLVFDSKGLTDDERGSLLKQITDARNALTKSVEAGVFTEAALAAL